MSDQRTDDTEDRWWSWRVHGHDDRLDVKDEASGRVMVGSGSQELAKDIALTVAEKLRRNALVRHLRGS